MFKKLKENSVKEPKEMRRKMSHPIENISNEVEIVFKK